MSHYIGIIQLVVTIAIVVFGGYGWVCNIIELVGSSEFSGMVVARAIGIVVAPLGAVLGYL